MKPVDPLMNLSAGFSNIGSDQATLQPSLGPELPNYGVLESGGGSLLRSGTHPCSGTCRYFPPPGGCKSERGHMFAQSPCPARSLEQSNPPTHPLPPNWPTFSLFFPPLLAPSDVMHHAKTFLTRHPTPRPDFGKPFTHSSCSTLK